MPIRECIDANQIDTMIIDPTTDRRPLTHICADLECDGYAVSGVYNADVFIMPGWLGMDLQPCSWNFASDPAFIHVDKRKKRAVVHYL